MTPDKNRTSAFLAKRSLPKHQRFKALMLMVVSLALLGSGIFFAKTFLTNQASLEKAAKEFSNSDHVSHLTAEDVKDVLAQPASIEIRSLNINAPVVPVALAADGTLQVPADSNKVGWFAEGTKPGEKGPAIMTGHIDAAAGPAIFWKLGRLRPEDQVRIIRSDNSIVTFRVDRLEHYPQDNFPSQRVYGQTDGAGLRLITCAGSYNPKLGRYSDNLVVYATLVDVTPGQSR